MEPFSPRVACMPAGCCHAVQRTSERERLRENAWQPYPGDLGQISTWPVPWDLSHLTAGAAPGESHSHLFVSGSLRMHASGLQLSATIPVPSLWKMFVFALSLICSSRSIHACHLVHACVSACTLNVQAPNPEKPSPPLCLSARKLAS
jgi:hypothetical protein